MRSIAVLVKIVLIILHYVAQLSGQNGGVGNPA